MQLIISASDQVVARIRQPACRILGEGQARTASSRGLNHEGDKGQSPVKYALVRQNGIKYGAVDKGDGDTIASAVASRRIIILGRVLPVIVLS
jgi:hypothetical protein